MPTGKVTGTTGAAALCIAAELAIYQPGSRHGSNFNQVRLMKGIIPIRSKLICGLDLAVFMTSFENHDRHQNSGAAKVKVNYFENIRYSFSEAVLYFQNRAFHRVKCVSQGINPEP